MFGNKKRIFPRILAMLVCLCLCTAIAPQTANAASISISASSTTVEVGPRDGVALPSTKVAPCILQRLRATSTAS